MVEARATLPPHVLSPCWQAEEKDEGKKPHGVWPQAESPAMLRPEHVRLDVGPHLTCTSFQVLSLLSNSIQSTLAQACWYGATVASLSPPLILSLCI